MPKYDENTKKACVNAVKAIVAGKPAEVDGRKILSLKCIQQAIGPNPLATKRYCKKAGVDVKGVPRSIPAKTQPTK